MPQCIQCLYGFQSDFFISQDKVIDLIVAGSKTIDYSRAYSDEIVSRKIRKQIGIIAPQHNLNKQSRNGEQWSRENACLVILSTLTIKSE